MGLLDQYGQWQWPASFTGTPANADPVGLPAVPDYAPDAFPFDLGAIFGQGAQPDPGQVAQDVAPTPADTPQPMNEADAAAQIRAAEQAQFAGPDGTPEHGAPALAPPPDTSWMGAPPGTPGRPAPASFAEKVADQAAGDPMGDLTRREGWLSAPPGTPGRPAPVSFRDKVVDQVAGDPMRDVATNEDLAKFGGSEMFASERDPAAADQAQADLQEAYARNPELLAQAELDRKAAMEARAATAEKEQALAEKAAFDAAVKAREDARAKAMADRAQIETDAKAMADGSPFAQWWSTRGTGEKIAGYIGAIFGGLMQGQTGGRNSALDAMMKVADDDAAQKWKSIQTRREMNGEDLGDADAQFRMQEAIRAASREQMARQIEADLANYDPNNKRAIDGAKAAAMLRAASKAELDKAQADAEALKIKKDDAESRRITALAQKTQADSLAAQRAAKMGGGGGAGGSGGISGTGAGDWGPKAVHTGDEWAKHLGLDPTKIKATPPSGPLNGKEFDAWFDAQKVQGNISAEAEREANIRQERMLKAKQWVDEREINAGGDAFYIYGDDGKPKIDPETGEYMKIHANTPEEGKLARSQLTNTVEAIKLLHQAKAIRDRMSTGDSKLPWKEAKLQLDVISNAIGPLVKEGTEGMSSDSDINRLVGGVGADNLNSFLDQTAKIDQGIRVATNLMNAKLRKYHYNGPAYVVPPPPSTAPKQNELAARLSSRDAPDASTGAVVGEAIKRPISTPLKVLFGHGVKKNAMTDDQKAALEIAKADLDRPNDPDAMEAAEALRAAALEGQNAAAQTASAVTLWGYIKTGHPAARAIYDGMGAAEKAQLVRHLTASERHQALVDTATPDAPAAGKAP